jgi:hypothetical protein
MSVADRDESVVLRIDPARGAPERQVFVPRSGGEWGRHDQVWTGCAWRTRGVETVRDVSVSGAAAESV